MTMRERHHPFCNQFSGPREGCRMCERMFMRYPLQEGESALELIGRCFPNAVVRRSDGWAAPMGARLLVTRDHLRHDQDDCGRVQP